MNLHQLNDKLKVAICPEEIFGSDVAHMYRELVKLCHTDLVPVGLKTLAEDTFIKLHNWREIAQKKQVDGTYGDNKPYILTPPPNPPYVETTFTISSKEIRLVSLLGEGLISSIHRATISDGDPKRQYFVKISRHPKDNDLLEREYRNLMILHVPGRSLAEEDFFKIQRNYLPKPEELFYVAGSGGVQRRVLLLSTPTGDGYTLEQLLKMPKFKNGIDRKHMYWIYRRILLTLLLVHTKKIVHGAVTPNHVLVFPKEHGLVLLDWSTSVWQNKEHISVVDPDWRSFYPPEVFRKEKTTPTVDLYMAAQTMLHCVDELPNSVRNALNECTSVDVSHRPADALTLYGSFERVIVDADGPRKFSEMII